MKKMIALFLVLTLTLSVLFACAPAATGETVRLGGMTGPTSIGMAKLLSDDAAGESKNNYEFTLAESGIDIRTKLIKGELDIAAIPANLASALFKATNGEICVLAVNTLGVVSLLEKGESVHAISDLRGKKVYMPATAKGAIPEIVFQYFLSLEGMTAGVDLTVEAIPADTPGAKLKNEPGAVILSPEPAATTLLSKVEGARRALSLDEEWGALDNGSSYITGVTVVRRSYAEAHPDVIKAFLWEYERSIAYAGESPAETAALVNAFGILSQEPALITAAIPSCNLAFLSGQEMKASLSTYFSLLVPVSPAAFGGEVPADDFYYMTE